MGVTAARLDGMRTLTKEAKVTVKQHVPMHQIYGIMDIDKFRKLARLYEQAEDWAIGRADDALGVDRWTPVEDVDWKQWQYHFDVNRDERFNYLCKRNASKASWNSPTRKAPKTTVIKRKVK